MAVRPSECALVLVYPAARPCSCVHPAARPCSCVHPAARLRCRNVTGGGFGAVATACPNLQHLNPPPPPPSGSRSTNYPALGRVVHIQTPSCTHSGVVEICLWSYPPDASVSPSCFVTHPTVVSLCFGGRRRPSRLRPTSRTDRPQTTSSFGSLTGTGMTWPGKARAISSSGATLTWLPRCARRSRPTC